ncbi:hypothetical protein QJS10_CPB04g01541 [Acorus calamus]|uniref:Uncharacterized protein n=1 Tax=Acorus calamus TaxID=4465 RepID=A0AAV9F377_ACOCL|nr:hypothetical protein QJS10_CPB04g01541 [Acorus calamus]
MITPTKGESAQYVTYQSENQWASGQGDRMHSRCAPSARVHNGSQLQGMRGWAVRRAWLRGLMHYQSRRFALGVEVGEMHA